MKDIGIPSRKLRVIASPLALIASMVVATAAFAQDTTRPPNNVPVLPAPNQPYASPDGFAWGKVEVGTVVVTAVVTSLATILGTFFTLKMTAKAERRKNSYLRLWERRERAYSQLIEAFQKLQDGYDAEHFAGEENSPAIDPEQIAQERQVAIAVIRKAIDQEGWDVSEEVAAKAHDYFGVYPMPTIPTDAFQPWSDEAERASRTRREIIELAKKDLAKLGVI